MDTQGMSERRFPRTGKRKRKGPGESREREETPGETIMSQHYDELKKMSKEELIKRYNGRANNTDPRPPTYIDEIRHRELMGALEDIRKCLAELSQKRGGSKITV